ncbi:Putative hypothetical protein [Helicobacter mustelae 12198]|uniref:Uncharacterized protein n=1 Tax=Helicobacter mustelae (strain ATCC 43772 / CCUG 25715 / CIP 103759 / LMG 18044 / NCTC 12198 / R85-136P) TaxID=679897 RepID=D3UIK5_HELM1|nr:Putative hypothetical protein [Helicobacter mustelae 12198]
MGVRILAFCLGGIVARNVRNTRSAANARKIGAEQNQFFPKSVF